MILAACGGTMLICRPTVRADISESVSSTASESYVRTKLPDGSFKPETYSFGEGGHVAGPARDDSIDQLQFMDVARVVAEPLARRNYLPATDRNPEKTRLLIMVYWGTTNGATSASSSDGYQKLQAAQGGSQMPASAPPEMSLIAHCSCDTSALNTNIAGAVGGMTQNDISGAFAVVAAENKLREHAIMQNAVLLGYDSELASASRLQLTAFRSRRDDLVNEIVENRDFVVLKAYDFQELLKHKKRNLLWVTRLSVKQRGTNFAGALPALVSNASQYFGQNTFGLLRKPLPEGSVAIGDVKYVGIVPGK
jgi:hypothetical protein